MIAENISTWVDMHISEFRFHCPDADYVAVVVVNRVSNILSNAEFAHRELFESSRDGPYKREAKLAITAPVIVRVPDDVIPSTGPKLTKTDTRFHRSFSWYQQFNSSVC